VDFDTSGVFTTTHFIIHISGWERDMRLEQSKSLIDLLIKEFHIWETLLRLTREERQALFTGDMSNLADLAREKEMMFGELALYQHSRRELLKYLLGSQLCESEYIQGPSMQRLLVTYSPDEAHCLQRLSEGIEILVGQMEDLARGNYALADCAMKRAWALQTWLETANQKSLTSPV
jgi:hypothetical protein